MPKKPITRLASEMARLPAAPFIPGITWGAAPTEAIGSVGSKPFVGDPNATASRQNNTEAYKSALNSRVPVQNMNDLSSPAWWGKNLALAAKSNFYDPIANLPNAFDPTSGLSPIERVNTGLGGGLALADAITPFLPEGALANAMVQRAANRTLAETGTTSFVKSGPINIMGHEVPYGPEAARYAAKLARLDRTMGTKPGMGVASIGMTEKDAADVLRNGIYDPILGKAGIIQSATPDYATARNLLENHTGAPVYGYQRYAGDMSTASGYRNPYAQNSGAILNVDPSAVRTMTEGDSMYLYDTHRGMKPENLLDQLFSPYDPKIAPPRPGYGQIGEDLAKSAAERNKLTEIFYDTYRELQMKPINVADDVQSVALPRGESGTDSVALMNFRLELAKLLAQKNIPYASGKVLPLEQILAKDIKNIGYPQDVIDRLYGASGMVPDPAPLHRLPSRWSKSWEDTAPYREVVDF